MDDSDCRQYFLAPRETAQRRYEALRAVFVDGESLDTVAQRFGYTVATLKSMASRFRADCRRGVTPPFSFRTDGDDTPGRIAATTDTAPKSRRSRTVGN
jgi:hypothetical protein